MYIKITHSSKPGLWYAKHIGEVFVVYREEEDSYAARELEWPYAINFVYKEDCAVLEKPEVKYRRFNDCTIVEGQQADVYALDHPRLGRRWVVTSTVLEVHPNGDFETLNTKYILDQDQPDHLDNA
jgi:hypothetical protein